MTKVPKGPSNKFIGEVGATPRPGYQPPSKDEEAPQRLGDSGNLRGPGYDGTVKLGGWLRGPDATKAPFFRKTKV